MFFSITNSLKLIFLRKRRIRIMNAAEILGFIHFWGLSPAINLLKYNVKDKGEMNILISGGSDIRHLLKTCSDVCTGEKRNLNFYFHEKQKEVLARQALQILIFCLDISEREKMELFLEFHSNSMLRDRSAKFLDQAIKVLTKFKFFFTQLHN